MNWLSRLWNGTARPADETTTAPDEASGTYPREPDPQSVQDGSGPRLEGQDDLRDVRESERVVEAPRPPTRPQRSPYVGDYSPVQVEAWKKLCGPGVDELAVIRRRRLEEDAGIRPRPAPAPYIPPWDPRSRRPMDPPPSPERIAEARARAMAQTFTRPLQGGPMNAQVVADFNIDASARASAIQGSRYKP